MGESKYLMSYWRKYFWETEDSQLSQLSAAQRRATWIQERNFSPCLPCTMARAYVCESQLLCLMGYLRRTCNIGKNIKFMEFSMNLNIYNYNCLLICLISLACWMMYILVTKIVYVMTYTVISIFDFYLMRLIGNPSFFRRNQFSLWGFHYLMKNRQKVQNKCYSLVIAIFLRFMS